MRSMAIFVLLCIMLLVQASCTDPAVPTRVDLQAAVDSYINALKEGDPSIMPLASEPKYIENMEEVPMGEGIWKASLNIDFHRSLLDAEISETFTEVISASSGHPYVLGTRLKIEDGKPLTLQLENAEVKADKLILATNYEAPALGFLRPYIVGSTLAGSFTRKLTGAELASLGSLTEWGAISLHSGGATCIMPKYQRNQIQLIILEPRPIFDNYLMFHIKHRSSE